MTKDMPWLESHLRPLRAWGDQIAAVRPEIHNTFGPWTCLKLVALKFHSDLYTTIMNRHLSRLGFKSIVYVDVLAGSGLNHIRGTGVSIAGSSIVASQAPIRRKYDFILAIENDQRYATALSKRLGAIRDAGTYEVVPYDASMHIDTIEKLLLERNAHYVAFVDYEGMSGFPWDNMEKLLRHKGDLFITFIPNIGRVLDRDWNKDREAVGRLVGRDIADAVGSSQEIFPAYLEKIRRLRPHTIDIKIQSGAGYHYILIFAAGQKSLPGWFGALRDLKTKLEALDGEDVKLALDQIEGKQGSLDDGRWS